MNSMVNIVNENHEYVASVNTVFFIFTYSNDYRSARRFYRDDAEQIIRDAKKHNPHLKLQIVS